MHERHTVVEAYDVVFDVVGLLGAQLREHRLYHPAMPGDSLGPDLIQLCQTAAAMVSSR